MAFSLFARRTSISLATIIAASIVSTASADPVSDFYKNESIKFIISSSPGGGYDTYARTIANHIGRHIPGNPNIVAQNMPGAGGLKATNWLYNVAPQDASVIAAVHNTIPFQPLFGEKRARYDALKLNWLGTANTEVAIPIVWHTSPVKSIPEAREQQIALSATGGGSTSAFYGRALNTFVGTKFNIVTGYPGGNEAYLAMERGEVQGYPSIFWSTLQSSRPEWLRENKIIMLTQMTFEKHPKLPDVPLVFEYVENEQNRSALELAIAPLELGRVYVAPPNVPSDRVKALRNAFHQTLQDEKFRADAEKRRLEITNPKTGKQAEELIRRIYDRTPPDVVERVAEIRKG